MKKQILLCIMLLPACLFAQQFKFYVNGKDISRYTFTLSGDSALLVKATFTNTTSYNFTIAAVSVILRVPQYSNPAVQVQSADGYTTVTEVVKNSEVTFTKKPVMSFDLRPIIEKNNCSNCEISFKVNQLQSNTEEGDSWVDDHLLYNEVALKKSMSTNATMYGKGQ